MKFIREKLTKGHLIRRIQQENAKSDRKVVEVELTPSEWHEFINTLPFDTPLANPVLREFHIAIAEPASPGDYGRLPWKVTVKCGAP